MRGVMFELGVGCWCTLVLPVSQASAKPAEVKIKAATMAPGGSTWHRGMQQIAERWEEESGGQVKLVIYPGGVQGDEGDCIRKMRIGQLQACAITGFSLGDITPEPLAISVPLMIGSYAELDYVMDKVKPRFEKALEEEGFVALAWTDAGIMHFFSKSPAAAPEQAFHQKVMAPAGNPAMTEAWRRAGFQPVALSSIDTMAGLQTGMLDALVNVPLVTLGLNWYTAAPNMTDVPLGALVGTLVVSKRAWEKVPAELRARLLGIAREEGEAMKPIARREGEEAVSAMEKRGLNVVEPTAEQQRHWEELSDKLFPAMRGNVVPEEAFDAVKAARDEFRSKRSQRNNAGKDGLAGTGNRARRSAPR